MPIDLDHDDASRDWIRSRKTRVVAECGGLYLVSLDGSSDEGALGVVYTRDTGVLSPKASLASHLKMMHGYSMPFRGTAEERERIEAEVRELRDQ
jgi:hypothetical protein